ncbi:hypothetical protein [Streptomyces sp. 4F14]|uniref:hypothetical protein n=1 Tax=Streptomyces sp. 4F14 TaxID=3394380 RepID=UPI003A87EE3F
MNVEIPPSVIESAARHGAGVPYALKAVAGRLADDPDLGTPSDLPGILTVHLDDGMIEDCPALAIGYLREPDRIEIRHVTPATPPAEPPTPAPHPATPPTDPAADALTARQIADAWHRITTWLRHNAPDSYAALRPGAVLDTDLGTRVPVELQTLWLLTAGDDAGCLPHNMALMPLDAVVTHHRRRMQTQAQEDAHNTGRAEDDRVTVWKPTWIPVVSHGPHDTTSGMYLDTETGFLRSWSLYNDVYDEELDTLVTYLEETADMLENPALATRDRPGLIGGTLFWRSGLIPGQENAWRPL